MVVNDCDLPPAAACEDGVARVLAPLREETSGLSISDISRKIHLNRNSVAKYLGVLVTLGQVEMHTVGSAKVYRLSSRPSVLKLFDYIQDGMIIVDADLRLRGINQAGCDRLGLIREDVLDRAVAGIAYPFLETLVTSDVFSRAIRGTENFSEVRADPGIGASYQVLYIPVVLVGGRCGVAITLREIPPEGNDRQDASRRD